MPNMVRLNTTVEDLPKGNTKYIIDLEVNGEPVLEPNYSIECDSQEAEDAIETLVFDLVYSLCDQLGAGLIHNSIQELPDPTL